MGARANSEHTGGRVGNSHGMHAAGYCCAGWSRSRARHGRFRLPSGGLAAFWGSTDKEEQKGLSWPGAAYQQVPLLSRSAVGPTAVSPSLSVQRTARSSPLPPCRADPGRTGCCRLAARVQILGRHPGLLGWIVLQAIISFVHWCCRALLPSPCAILRRPGVYRLWYKVVASRLLDLPIVAALHSSCATAPQHSPLPITSSPTNFLGHCQPADPFNTAPAVPRPASALTL